MNYIGSKFSLIDFLKSSVTTVLKSNGEIRTPNEMVFADLFAGTGVVCGSFKQDGYSIIANDIQYYSYVITKHIIENNGNLDKNKCEQLIEKLKKFGVHYIYLKDQTWKDMGEVFHRGSNRFDDCNMKRCTSLYEGKIYVCSRAAIMAKMGKVPDEGIPLTLPAKRLKTELKRLYSGKYSKACSYCDGDTQYAIEIVAGEQG